MKPTYFVSRHSPTEDQMWDMVRICREQNAALPIHIKDWNNHNFRSKRLSYEMFEPGSIIFLVGTTEHAIKAKKLGYTIYIPKFNNRTTFLRHVQFLKAKVVEVPA